MKLYLDLNKAIGQTPNVGLDTPTEEQSVAESEGSYGRESVGVASGESSTPDDPDVGASWKHDEDSSVSNDTKDKLSDRKKKDKDDGIIKSAVEILESVNKSMDSTINYYINNPREIEFLTSVLGYSEEDVSKGLAVITGHNRSLFNRWLCDRLLESTTNLTKSLGAYIG